LLVIGDDDIQPVDGAAQKNDDKPSVATIGSGRPDRRAGHQHGRAG
jgi:hypothetical protein